MKEILLINNFYLVIYYLVVDPKRPKKEKKEKEK
jgi:hypothetical protein